MFRTSVQDLIYSRKQEGSKRTIQFSLSGPLTLALFVLLCWVQWDVRMRLHTSTLQTVCAACSLLGLQASLPSCSLYLLCETLALEWRLWMTTFLPWFTSHTTGVSIPWATAWMPVKFHCSEISLQQPGVECVHSPYIITCVCKQIQTICVSNVTHTCTHAATCVAVKSRFMASALPYWNVPWCITALHREGP